MGPVTLGVFFAIDAVQAETLANAGDDDELMDLVKAIEEAWDEENLAEVDKAWDAMHRALTDGQLRYGNGEYPLSHCVLGPRQLHRGDDSIVSLVRPDEVSDVAGALALVTEDWFRDRYRTIVPRDYAPEYGEDDLDYTWESLDAPRQLYAKAAAEGRAMLFTVSQ
jgi:hypothetical protein